MIYIFLVIFQVFNQIDSSDSEYTLLERRGHTDGTYNSSFDDTHHVDIFPIEFNEDSSGSDEVVDDDKTIVIELLKAATSKLLQQIIQLNLRRSLRPRVEVGPGAFKSEIIKYPDNKLTEALKKLLALKKKSMHDHSK